VLAAEPFDLVLKNGRVVDGAGTPWYIADVAIRNGKIAEIGRLNGRQAARTIDASGLVVAPGFIDMLGQSELTMLVDPICRRRSIRASPRRSPAKAARLRLPLISWSRRIGSPMSTMEFSPPGERCANISRGCASKAWASIWRRMSGRRKSGVW
jgi:hypothetical protein